MNGPLLFGLVPVHLKCVWFAVMEILFALEFVFDRIQSESVQGFNAWIFCKTQTHWKSKIIRRPASNSMCNARARVSLSSGYRNSNNNQTHVEFVLKLDIAWLKPVRCDWTRPSDVHEMSTNCNPIEAKSFEKYAMFAKINHIRSYRGKLRIVLVFAFNGNFHEFCL